MQDFNTKINDRCIEMQDEDEVTSIFSNFTGASLRKDTMRDTKEFTKYMRPRVTIYDSDKNLVKAQMRTALDEADSESGNMMRGRGGQRGRGG